MVSQLRRALESSDAVTVAQLIERLGEFDAEASVSVVRAGVDAPSSYGVLDAESDPKGWPALALGAELGWSAPRRISRRPDGDGERERPRPLGDPRRRGGQELARQGPEARERVGDHRKVLRAVQDDGGAGSRHRVKVYRPRRPTHTVRQGQAPRGWPK